MITAGLLDENTDEIRGESGSQNKNRDSDGPPIPNARAHDQHKRFRLLDVGIGCGDQSLRALGYKRVKAAESQSGPGAAEKNDGEKDSQDASWRHEPLFDSYTGITSIPVQARFASERVHQYQQEQEQNQQQGKKNENPPKANIFCANAANPSSWPAELNSSILPKSKSKPESKSESPPQDTNQPLRKDKQGTWLLALDTLYHFTPSRLPLLTYTKNTLSASLMAFDLCISNETSLWQRLLLRLLCLFAGMPYGNFLTEEGYKDLLVRAGYEENKIVFRDVSGDVFSGIAGFIDRRDNEVRRFGLGKGLGKFREAGRVFRWWARTGVVRGVIIVARV